ncbi:MAG: ribosome small subunit-dependent GTPase A [Gracilibacteraceae bacterium]|jgi:ribosome biogenesis GTPase|nr:ribosome small subunit-dependent GTPase A [Gracilibacteraceae bacterium]
MRLRGKLLRGYGGFYYVYAEGRVWECSLRGRFRLQNQSFLPGDEVEILADGDGGGTLEQVLPRKNSLRRPPVANVDLAVLVFSIAKPPPDETLLNRLLVQAMHAGLDVIIVFTKADLLSPAEGGAPDLYREAGFETHRVSALTGDGADALGARLRDRIAVLAGQSGVGKTTLLNALGGLSLKTGELSAKLGRGRHTTRHVELLRVAGGLVADTPGFSSYNLPEMKPAELARCFPEMSPYADGCRFKSCLHDKEPDCRVKEAVAAGGIAGARYEYYLSFLHELRGRKPKNPRRRGEEK